MISKINQNWVFGKNAGLRFRDTTPDTVVGQRHQHVGGLCIHLGCGRDSHFVH